MFMKNAKEILELLDKSEAEDKNLADELSEGVSDEFIKVVGKPWTKAKANAAIDPINKAFSVLETKFGGGLYKKLAEDANLSSEFSKVDRDFKNFEKSFIKLRDAFVQVK